MKHIKKILRYSILIGIVLILGILFMVHTYYGALFSAQPIERSEITSDPVAILLIQPRNAAPFVHAFVNRQAPVKIPRWAVDRSLPYEATILLSEHSEEENIDIRAFISLPRFSPAAARYINDQNLLDKVPEINWTPPLAQIPQSGTILLEGNFPMEEETLDDVWMQWNQSIRPSPLTLAEGHFIEGVIDNRIGTGYLAMASILNAFNIELDDKEQEISLTSFQFVLSIRLAVDISNNNSMSIYFVIEILPEAKQRLAVINLKIALDDAFDNMGRDLAQQHQINMTGKSIQTENIIEYTYSIDNAMKFVEILLEGEL